SVYLDEILYTGKDGKEGKYFVSFEYFDGIDGRNLRKDGRIDARSGNIIESNYLLKSIKTGYDKEAVRTYEFIYGERIAASEKYLKEFKVWNKGNKESYSYFFDYNELDLNNIFASPEEYSFNEPIQAGVSKSTTVNGSVSGGAGVGGSSIDVRVTGGAQGSVTTGTSYSNDTIADMDGDGKPDSVSYDINEPEKIVVYLQSGKKWNIDCSEFDDDVELDVEKSSGDTGGYTVYGGAGKRGRIKAKLGVSYSKVNQNGSARVLKTIADMDGDGLGDIVQSEHSFYLHNNGDGTFTKKNITATTDMPLSEYERKFTVDEINDYKDAYRQQLPFRIWKAPYNGKIKIKNEGQYASDNARKEKVVLKTFINENSKSDLNITLDSNEPKSTEDRTSRKIEQNANVYFAVDTGSDPKDADIIWNNTIEYESVQIFNDMNSLPIFLPVKNVKYDKDNYNYSGTGYSEFYIKTGYPQECYNTVMVNENEGQNTAYAHYVVTGTLKEDWQKELTDETKSVTLALNLIKENRVIPRYFDKEHFDKVCDAVYKNYKYDGPDLESSYNGVFLTPDGIEQKESLIREHKITHLERFASHFKYDVTKGVYEYISGGHDEDEKFLTTYLKGINFKEYLYEYYEKNGITPDFSCSNVIYRQTIEEDNTEKPRQRDVTGSIYDTKYLYLGEILGKRVVFDSEEKMILLDGKTTADGAFQEIDGKILVSFTYDEKYKMDFTFSEADNKAMSITNDEVQAILEQYKKTVSETSETPLTEEEIENKARELFDVEFGQYFDGNYELIDYWAEEKTQSDFTKLDDEGKTVKDEEAYKAYRSMLSKLKELCIKFGLVKYNKCVFAMTYINDAEYDIKNGKCLFLKSDDSSVKLDYDSVEVKKKIWNSKNDYSNENLSNPVRLFEDFSYYVTVKRINKTNTEIYTYEPVKSSEEDEEDDMQVIEVAPDESYYGGCNQWYYGIWNARGKFNPQEFNPVKDINPEGMKKQIEDEEKEISDKEDDLENLEADRRE
ncbi:hypothetical protein, partial [Treponema sp.]|uniref:hypothetical protein n=1 Tax=Treponema sp. TaxID=166 RepID=UPI00298DF0A8